VKNQALFSVEKESPEPIYRQLVEQMRRLVCGGQLCAGEAVPSVRELAQALEVNAMTVSKAFGVLEAEGLLERRRGLTMVVAPQRRGAKRAAERIAMLRPTLQRAAAEAHQLELTVTQALRLFEATLLEYQGSAQ
jgi:GntR family transcriptional regulator